MRNDKFNIFTYPSISFGLILTNSFLSNRFFGGYYSGVGGCLGSSYSQVGSGILDSAMSSNFAKFIKLRFTYIFYSSRGDDTKELFKGDLADKFPFSASNLNYVHDFFILGVLHKFLFLFIICCPTLSSFLSSYYEDLLGLSDCIHYNILALITVLLMPSEIVALRGVYREDGYYTIQVLNRHLCYNAILYILNT